MPRAVLPAVAVAGLAGCAEDVGPPEAGPAVGAEAEPQEARQPTVFQAPASLPGDLLLVEGRLRFRPCGQNGAQPVDDGTAGEAHRIVRELGFGGGVVRVAAVLDGERLVEVRYAAPEAVGCEDLLPDARLRAQGNEPFWSLTVDEEGARWRTPERAEPLRFSGGEWERSGQGWLFQATGSDADEAESLRLEVVEERCVDSMSGSRFPFSATVRLDGATVEGCALEGTQAVARP